MSFLSKNSSARGMKIIVFKRNNAVFLGFEVGLGLVSTTLLVGREEKMLDADEAKIWYGRKSRNFLK